MELPDFFRVVLGPCEQFCPFEAMEQNGAKTKCQNRMKFTELCQLDSRTLKLAYFWPKIDYFDHIFVGYRLQICVAHLH